MFVMPLQDPVCFADGAQSFHVMEYADMAFKEHKWL